MKYIKPKKIFESGKIPEDLKYCFDNLGDLPGFYLENEAFEYSVKLCHVENKFNYTLDMLVEIEESLDRTKELHLKLDRSWVEPSDRSYMTSGVMSRKNAIGIDGIDYWLGEEFPEPDKLFFIKYPAYRKIYLSQKKDRTEFPMWSFLQLEAKITQLRGDKKFKNIEYPISQEDILYTTSLKSISFLFFE